MFVDARGDFAAGMGVAWGQVQGVGLRARDERTVITDERTGMRFVPGETSANRTIYNAVALFCVIVLSVLLGGYTYIWQHREQKMGLTDYRIPCENIIQQCVSQTQFHVYARRCAVRLRFGFHHLRVDRPDGTGIADSSIVLLVGDDMSRFLYREQTHNVRLKPQPRMTRGGIY